MPQVPNKSTRKAKPNCPLRSCMLLVQDPSAPCWWTLVPRSLWGTSAFLQYFPLPRLMFIYNCFLKKLRVRWVHILFQQLLASAFFSWLWKCQKAKLFNGRETINSLNFCLWNANSKYLLTSILQQNQLTQGQNWLETEQVELIKVTQTRKINSFTWNDHDY